MKFEMQIEECVAMVVMTNTNDYVFPKIPGGVAHMEAQVIGPDQESARKCAAFILDLFAGSREAFIRVWPEGYTHNDFESGGQIHKGYVRFSFRPRHPNYGELKLEPKPENADA